MSLLCWLRVGVMSLTMAHWHLTDLSQRRDVGLESLVDGGSRDRRGNDQCQKLALRLSSPLCTPPSVSLSLFLFLCLSLSVSLCLCLCAWWCRAGQVTVIQGCKLEEDWDLFIVLSALGHADPKSLSVFLFLSVCHSFSCYQSVFLLSCHTLRYEDLNLQCLTGSASLWFSAAMSARRSHKYLFL